MRGIASVARPAEYLGQDSAPAEATCSELGPLCDRLLDWTGNADLSETLAWVLGTPLKVVGIILAALLLNRAVRAVLRRLVDRLGAATSARAEGLVSQESRNRAQQRASTVGSLLRSISSGIIFTVAVVMVLEQVGISIAPLIASAGILGLAIGFGAQSVVEDLLRGLFMLGEDQFGVGDRINVGTVEGFVERLTLRTVLIRDADGILWHIPNSELSFVANENQRANRAVVDIGVAYDADLNQTMDVLQKAAVAACDHPDWRDAVTSPARVLGVQELGDYQVVIRVELWVESGRMRGFERMLRLRLKGALDAAGIEMPNPTYDVRLRPAAEPL